MGDFSRIMESATVLNQQRWRSLDVALYAAGVKSRKPWRGIRCCATLCTLSNASNTAGSNSCAREPRRTSIAHVGADRRQLRSLTRSSNAAAAA